MRNHFPLIGRLLIAPLFLIEGINKIIVWDDTLNSMIDKGVPIAPLFLIIATGIEVLGGAFLITGFFTKIFSLIMALYLIPVTLVFHHDIFDPNQLMHLVKNIAIVGALIYVSFYGAGVESLDEKLNTEGK